MKITISNNNSSIKNLFLRKAVINLIKQCEVPGTFRPKRALSSLYFEDAQWERWPFQLLYSIWTYNKSKRMEQTALARHLDDSPILSSLRRMEWSSAKQKQKLLFKKRWYFHSVL